jgi:hypothetical protein
MMKNGKKGLGNVWPGLQLRDATRNAQCAAQIASIATLSTTTISTEA